MSVTLILIVANVLVSMLALYVVPQVFEKGMMMPYRVVRENTWYELISSGFIHAGIGHLFLNMFVLFFFGLVLERSVGREHFIALYLTGLIISSLPSLFQHKDNPDFATVGASGAVEGVLFGFIVLFPLDPIYIMFIPFGIPAIVFGILFLIYSVYASRREGKVNHEAHIAGAVWGVLYMIIFVPNTIDHFLTVLGLL
ncbi:MAG: rhomboid family intramembrane serine protease [Balneola sp.]|jgi:membrane associated rhomboid family serine protease|nr:rhomboid family intramembrane serine protease [Balneola sp.]MBE78225.1 rhomboid family intramembrane serine protease [Balneola sp.]HBX66438.1 rhomboid family intramembrane serine protease [Balneolaceae bacterium]|tara:strand:+ start:1918 stop:2511 length:594 start_codon:yes stop_codon:yes gene_type:complete